MVNLSLGSNELSLAPVHRLIKKAGAARAVKKLLRLFGKSSKNLDWQ